MGGGGGGGGGYLCWEGDGDYRDGGSSTAQGTVGSASQEAEVGMQNRSMPEAELRVEQGEGRPCAGEG